MARPRRFGKSLLVSTLAALFRGERTLFSGLWIENHYSWEPHPVIHLSFDRLATTDLGFKEALCTVFERVANTSDLTLPAQRSPKLYLEAIIESLYKKTKKGVVILVDECDRPLTDVLLDPTEANARREILRDVFSQLKPLEDQLRFVFFTGVTRFTKTSLFSELNNLFDLTFDPYSSTLCGYTEDELQRYFLAELQQGAKELNISEKAFLSEVRTWYNGYRWTNGPSVYNPFSVLSLFSSGVFRNYWFDSGAPRLILDLLTPLRKDQQLEEVQSTYSQLDVNDPADLKAVPLLFQTGYLTVRKEVGRGGVELGIPNLEVRTSLLQLLLERNDTLSLYE